MAKHPYPVLIELSKAVLRKEIGQFVGSDMEKILRILLENTEREALENLKNSNEPVFVHRAQGGIAVLASFLTFMDDLVEIEAGRESLLSLEPSGIKISDKEELDGTPDIPR